MKLTDHHWINKGCTVEILYGEHRTFLIQKTFKVVRMATEIPQTTHGLNYFILDVHGEEIAFCQSWLKLIEKPGYVRVKDGLWVETKTLDNQW